MKRLLLMIQLIFISTFTYGCSINSINNLGSTKIPTNKSLIIQGNWKVIKVDIINESVDETEKSLLGEEIIISNESIKIKDNIYSKPSYKLKVVDNKYVISYESELTLEDLVNDAKNVDVFTITERSNLICEFVLLSNIKGYIVYKGMVLEVEKSDTNISKSLENNINVDLQGNNRSLEEYDSDVGVMIGLKTARREYDEGLYTDETYRTLWISFKKNELQPIMKTDSLIFPRVNGMWELKKENIENSGYKYNYFHVLPYDYKLNNSIIDRNASYNKTLNENIYKSINFVGDDYISIETYNGKDFNNEFPIYKILPMDNVNSEYGISVDEIYSKEEIEKYKESFNNTLKSLSKEDRLKLDTKQDFTNIGLLRKDGRWSLVGKISPYDNRSSGVDFRLGVNVSDKLLNYNTLCIPWKVLRSEIPLINDAYTAPTGRLAVAVFKDSLAIYEIENQSIKGSPLANISLKDSEEIIMAEWCTGDYVDEWAKVFKNRFEEID